MDFYMIQTEQQLKKIIKETLLLSEVGYQLDDVIDYMQNDFTDSDDELKDANTDSTSTDVDKNFAKDVIISVRKNNTLLELILLLLDKESKLFEEFYKKSNLLPTELEEKESFLKKQEESRKKDNDLCKSFINTFISKIKTLSDEKNVAKDFIKSLAKLKKDLNNYIPKWYVLQYLFFNMNTTTFEENNKVIDEAMKEFINDKSNFIMPIPNIQAFQIPNNNFVSQKLLTPIIKSINDNGLSEDDKKIILSDMVGSDDFSEGIERGEWGWLTGAIDTAVNFFFPDVRSITSEIEDFFEKFEKTVGGKKNLQKLMDKVTGDVSIKGLLKKMGAGNITQKDIEKAANTIENMRMSAGLDAWNSGDEGE